MYHEVYGEWPTKLIRLFKRMNVSRSDLDTIQMVLGNDADAIEKAVKKYSPDGYFQVYLFVQGESW